MYGGSEVWQKCLAEENPQVCNNNTIPLGRCGASDRNVTKNQETSQNGRVWKESRKAASQLSRMYGVFTQSCVNKHPKQH